MNINLLCGVSFKGSVGGKAYCHRERKGDLRVAFLII